MTDTAVSKKSVNVNLDIIGRSGLPYWGGRVYAERHPKLRGIQGIRLYQEAMDNDATVGALMFLIETYIQSAEWRIEPAGESDEARTWAQFFDECVQDMSMTWEDLLSEILSMLGYGFMPGEICYKERLGTSLDPTKNSKYNDGKIGWRKIAPRAQDTLYAWEFDDDGGLRGMYQQSPPNYIIEFIPIEKLLLFRTKIVHGNPEGRSMLRNAMTAYHKKKRMQDIEATGVERDLSGYPCLEVPEELLMASANAAQKALRDQLQTLVEQIRRDEREGILLPAELNSEGKPTGYKLRLLTAGGRRAIDIGAIIQRYNVDILSTSLAQFIALGTSDKTGSFALASSTTNTFSVALGGWMDKIASVFNRYAFPRLAALNGCPPELTPKLEHGDLETPPLDEIASYVLKLSQAGFNLNDRKTERKLREMGKLPPPDGSYGMDGTDNNASSEPGGGATNPGGVAKPPAAAPAGPGVQPSPTVPKAPVTPGAPGPEGGEDETPYARQTSDPVDSAGTLPVDGYAGAPGALPKATPGATLPAQSLNGGQIRGLLDILSAVADGTLSISAGQLTAQLAFPHIDSAQAEALMGSLEVRPPPPGPDPQLPRPQEPGTSENDESDDSPQGSM